MNEPGLGRSVSRLIAVLRPRWLVGVFLVIALVDTAISAVLPMVWRQMFDHAIPDHDRRSLAILAGIAAGATALRLATSRGMATTLSHLSAATIAFLRTRLMAHTLGLSLAFFRTTPATDLLARFASDLDGLEPAISTALPRSFRGGLLAVVGLFLMFALDWRLATLLLLGTPLGSLAAQAIGSRASAAGMERSVADSRAASLVREAVASQPVLPLFGLEATWEARYAARVEEARRVSQRVVDLGLLSGFASFWALNATLAVVVCAGAALAVTGYTSVGSLVGFFAVSLVVSGGVEMVATALPDLLRGGGGLARVEAVLAEVPAVTDRAGAKPIAALSDRIRFEGVRFAYPGAPRPSLAGLTVDILRGQKVAIVGPSGSGKSTVLSMVLRLFDPEDGAIRWDGIDMRDATLASLRGHLGVVLQEPRLFDMTIRENIRLGRPDASDADVEAAARDAEIAAFIESLPEGYASGVGEDGSRLSGGQRQRIAIARALLRRPEVLVLDEVTSALDPATEAAVNATLERVGSGRTVLSVTHRLASIAAFDRVLVLDNGALVEDGPPAALIAQGGLFADLWNRQRGMSVSPDGLDAAVDPASLGAMPLFRELPPDVLASLAAALTTVVPAAGTVLFREGDAGDRLYVVARGTVEVAFREPPMIVLRSGDLLGEIALVYDRPRTATAIAGERCVLLALSGAQIERFTEQHPELLPRLRAAADARIAARPGGPA
jgi:ATP-binding cassette subfamily B protein